MATSIYTAISTTLTDVTILAAQKAGASSLGEVATALTARGIQPPRGDSWHPQMVRRILGWTT